MIENPTIDVIVPSYNQQEYLPDCIESILAQTLKPNRIIIVDDGSTDDSLEIARKYPVEVISQVNKGLPSARNTGIMNSTADYCFFLDADDIILDNCLEKISDRIKETGVDIVAPSLKEFGIGNATVILKPDISLEDFKKGNHLGYFCAIKRSKLLEIGGFSPRMLWGWEDYHLWINLFARGVTVSVIQEPLVLYRVKEKSMIHEANAHSEELWAQINKDFPNFHA